MRADRPFAWFTGAALRGRADVIMEELDRCSAEREAELLREVAAIGDEMIDRRRGDGPDDSGTTGVREPRRPSPSSGAAAAHVLRNGD